MCRVSFKNNGLVFLLSRMKDEQSSKPNYGRFFLFLSLDLNRGIFMDMLGYLGLNPTVTVANEGLLGGGFRYFLFLPLFGEDFQFY